MPRKAKAPQLPQTTLLLPNDLRQRLDKSRGERSLGEEIRQRLERTFEAEEGDAKTRNLMLAIADVVADINKGFGTWHEVPFAFQAMRAAITSLVGFFQPDGPPVPKATPGSAASFYYAGETPEEVGKGIANIVLRHRWESLRDLVTSIDASKRGGA